MSNLLESEYEVGKEVRVRNNRTGEVEDARVAHDGIVRELDGPACYSASRYDLL
jgi:hypothetical protein